MSDSRQYNFRLPAAVAEAFERAAGEAGLSLTSWVIQTGLVAAGESQLLTQLERVRAKRPKRAKKR